MATSAITFSGFNDIDFSIVLNAIMDQESQPLTALQTRQTELQKVDSNYATLVTKVNTLRTAANNLGSATSFSSYAATTSDSAALTASASSSAVPGRYEITVNELARRQTTTSASTTADTDTTIVATGGTITIGGHAVAVTGSVTLRGLVDTINQDQDSPATASIVATGPNAYRLVLTGKETGEANAFTIDNDLAGSIAFTDTDGDGISGDDAADNAVQATNASVLINNILVTSASNTLDAAIPGVSVTLQQKDPSKTIVVDVSRNDGDITQRVQAFVTAYNDLVKFATDQASAASKGTTGTLGRDAVLRSLRNELRNVLAGEHGSAAFTHLAEVGIGFNRTGQLVFDQAKFSQSLASNPSAVQTLFSNSTTGVFKNVDSLLGGYIASDGFVPSARTRISEELSRLGRRIDDMTERLAVRRRSLQAQFIAADQAMTSLKSQQSALSSFSSSLTSNS